jgi:hypothetical protein
VLTAVATSATPISEASTWLTPFETKPTGNGFFILYYGGSLDQKTKRATQETLDTMVRLWQLQPNFVVIAPEFKQSSEIVNIFHKTDGKFHPVKVLSYVIMTDESCEKLRSAKDIDRHTDAAMVTGYDGMFFDCTRQDIDSYPNIHGWNAERVAVARKYGNKLIIMNPGEALIDSHVFDYADIVSVENQYDIPSTAFVRMKGVEPSKSEKMEVAPWRWLAVQGDPSNTAAHTWNEAIDRLTTFRRNGGFWYYSSAYKSGDKLATATELPDWLSDFAHKVQDLGDCPCQDTPVSQGTKLRVLFDEGIYHGAFPEFGETEDLVTGRAITAFEAAVGKNIAWAYFSNNWFVENEEGKQWREIRFPREAVLTIWNHREQHRIVPFIRMMPRSTWKENNPDPIYTMQNIIDGKFDAELREWARVAKSIRTLNEPDASIPLIVEFGAEVNGAWFPWSGAQNGGKRKDGYGNPTKADGPERYRDAYRHVINLFRAEHADNIIWAFHVDAHPEPSDEWNNVADYYPGDDYIDLIGISVYGPQEPKDKFETFDQAITVNGVWQKISAMSSKPIAIVEFGIDDVPGKAHWITSAFKSISSHADRIRGISYWNSSQKNKNGYITKFTLSNDSLLEYRNAISAHYFISEVRLGR